MRKIPGTLYILSITRGQDEKLDISIIYRKEMVFQKSNVKSDEIPILIENFLNNNSLVIPKNRLQKVVNDEFQVLSTKANKPYMENAVFELLKESNDRTIDEFKKIVIIGLGNSGKTCIYERVFEGKKPWELLHSSVTKGISYKNYDLGSNFKPNIWDLGGQQEYLDKYHTSLSGNIFSQVNTFIFVIDISDPEKYDRSIEEFSWAMNQLNKYGAKDNIYVLFHKIDLIHEKEKISSFLKQKILKINQNAKIFETTIFNESLFSVWSDIIQKISPKSLYINTILKEFKNVIAIEDALLIDRNSGLTIGSTLKEQNDEIMSAMLSLLTYSLDRFSRELSLNGFKSILLTTETLQFRIYNLNKDLLLTLILNANLTEEILKNIEEFTQKISVNLIQIWGG